MRILTTLILCLTVLSATAQKLTLELSLEVGKEYRQRVNSNASMSQEVNGMNVDITILNNSSLVYKVKSTTDTSFCLDARYEIMELTMKMPQATMEFSSEKTEESDADFLSPMLRLMKTMSFEVVISRTGKVIEINNIDSLFDAGVGALDKLPEAARNQIKKQIGEAYGGDALKGSFEMITAIYANRPVAVGDKWNSSTNLRAGFAAKVDAEYELLEVTPDYVIIKGNSVIESEDTETYEETNGVPMRFDMKGSMISDIKADRKSGWIIEATFTQEVKGDAYMKPNSVLPEGLKMPMSISNVTKMTN